MGLRQSFIGDAPELTLSVGINSTATSIPVGAISNYPDYTDFGPFVITINMLEDDEEAVLIESYSGSTFNVAPGGRGYDSTTAQSHTAGATINHTIDAAWHQDVSTQLYDVAEGDLFYASADGTPAKLARATDGEILALVSSKPAWVAQGVLSGSAGQPTTGLHRIGETFVDSIGVLYICTATGTPGTWICPTGQTLAIARYNPSPTPTTYAAGTTTGAIDDTNFGVEFIVPPSGKVIFEFSCWASCSNAAFDFNLWDVNAGNIISNDYEQSMLLFNSGGNTPGARVHYKQLVQSGITPGDELFWAPAFRYVNLGGSPIASVIVGLHTGDGLVKVLSA